MTINLEKSAADGRRALRKARRRAGTVIDQARALDVPTMSEIGHRLDQVPATLEHAVDHAAKRTGRAARRRGLVPPTDHSRRRTGLRTTGIILALGVCVVAVVVATKQRRAADAAKTADPFGTAAHDTEASGRAASSSVRA